MRTGTRFSSVFKRLPGRQEQNLYRIDIKPALQRLLIGATIVFKWVCLDESEASVWVSLVN